MTVVRDVQGDCESVYDRLILPHDLQSNSRFPLLSKLRQNCSTEKGHQSRFPNPTTTQASWNKSHIDLLLKFHNAPVPHSTMHHFVTEVCTCGYIFVTKWCIMDLVSNALWELWDDTSVEFRNQFQWNFKQITIFAIQEDAFEDVVSKMWLKKSNFSKFKQITIFVIQEDAFENVVRKCYWKK